MNFARAVLLILTSGMFSGLNDAMAETVLPDTSFHDWSGVVQDVSLPDGSLLSDYMARTFSGRIERAMLAISFLPRFECAPLIRVRLPGTQSEGAAEPRLELSLDGDLQTFAVHVDQEGGFLTYALAVSTDQSIQLRRAIDASSRLRVRVLPPSDSPDNTTSAKPSAEAQKPGQLANSVVFSLLGSQRSTAAAESYCKRHQPVDFIPVKAEADDF